MGNCDYCGDFYNLEGKGKFCGITCCDLSRGRYLKTPIIKCKDVDNYYCECRACKRALFYKDIYDIKEQHNQWLLVREMI